MRYALGHVLPQGDRPAGYTNLDAINVVCAHALDARRIGYRIVIASFVAAFPIAMQPVRPAWQPTVVADRAGAVS